MAQPHARVVLLLVRLVSPLRVANLRLQVRCVVGDIIAHTAQEGPLHVRVDVHLDGTVGNGLADLLHAAARPSVEDEVHRAGTRAVLGGDVFLAVLQDFGGQLDVAGLVDAVYVSKRRGHRELIADRTQLLVGVRHFFRLRVEVGRVDVRVVHAIFFSPGHTELDLQEHAQRRHALEVVHTGLDVLFNGLLTEVDHVGGEQGLSGGLVKSFSLVQQAVDPRQQLPGAVVRVQHDRHTVCRGQLVDVMGRRHTAQNLGLLLVQFQGFAGIECGAAVGQLDNDG